jgi:hypothetical protein
MRALRYGSGFVAALLFSLPAACAHAQGGVTGPDFLQSLGVGSRSIAMGGAFSALADDASATFWNPGRLSVIRGRQFMLDYRTVLNAHSTSVPGAGGRFMDDRPRPGGFQPTFMGLVWPIYTRHRRFAEGQAITDEKYWGHLGLSFTLGGYFDRESLIQTPNITDPLRPNLLDEASNEQTVRNQFVTLAYGNRVDFGKKGRLGWGAGVVFLIHDQHFRDLSRTFDPSNPADTPTINSFSDQNFNGNGFGGIFGLAYGVGPEYRQWRLGLTYRPKIKIHFSDAGAGAPPQQGPSFADEIPSRLSVGLAYESDWGSRGDQVRAAVEGQFFSEANRDTVTFNQTTQLSQLDARVAASNLHVGFEYVPARSLLNRLVRGNIIFPVRLGFRTNTNAAQLYTHYTNVVTLGLGIQGRDRNNNITFSVEPAMEILTRNGAVLWNLTAMARF